MPGVGFNLTQSLKQQQTLAPQMRQGLKMLQMTSLELSAELQHAMETNPVIEDVTIEEQADVVRDAQKRLAKLGFYVGSIDGKYGPTTADAVRAFQIQNKLSPVDGVAGSKTLSKLYSSDAVAATAANPDYGTVQAGDRGDLVVQVQDCLVQMGFLDDITGVYDDATVAAVKAFQSANGLNPDGKCGPMTLQVLFGY